VRGPSGCTRARPEGRGVENGPIWTGFRPGSSASGSPSTSGVLLSEAGRRWLTPMGFPIVRQAKPGEEESEVDTEIFSASPREDVPPGQG
jgi:hypothetical protein